MFKNIKQSILVLGLVVSLVVPFAQAEAFTFEVQTTSVSIDDVVLSVCGPQWVYLSGTAEYAAPYDSDSHLEVQVDGVKIYSDGKHLENWLAPVFLPTAGQSYEAKAIIFDDRFAEEVGSVEVASDAINVIVAECEAEATPTPTPPPSTGGSGDGGSGGSGTGGGEADCCPGPDPVTSVTTTGTVKGASTGGGSTVSDLAPLNQTFRTVYGRTPTFEEWTYWANRYLTDKNSWSAILGAMQWHQLQGRTIGS